MKKRSRVVLPYYHRFDSEYKVGDVVSVRDPETGRKQVGTYTLMGQFQGAEPNLMGWWALRKWGSGDRYREENKPVPDADIIEWIDNNKLVRETHAKRTVIDAT